VRSVDTNRIGVGAQDCSNEEKGAFTGEISAEMIKAVGADYVILGHSERRTYQKEGNALLNKKTKLALKHDLTPIFCIGELLEEREAGKLFDVVKSQLAEGLFDLDAQTIGKIVIAYEPVWAIGTGVTASPEQAQEMHAYIRQLLTEQYGKSVADEISVLYGGSCNAKNAREIFSKPDVDGGLIGGASLKAEDFAQIIGSF
jgi:triosephosphate isomerase (TIM)